MRIKKRATALILLLSATILTLTGCIKVQADYNIKSDDTVDSVIVMAYSDQALQALSGLAGRSVEDIKSEMGMDRQIDEMQRQVGGNARVEPYAQDGYTGYKLTIKDQPIADMGKIYEGQLSLKREGDRFILEGTSPASDLNMPMEIPTDFPGMGPEMIPQIAYTFTFPGKVLKSTGKIDGNKVTYDLALGKQIDIQVEAEAVDSGMPMILLIGLGIGAVVVIAAVIVIFMQRSKKKGLVPTPAYQGEYRQPATGYSQPAAQPASYQPQAPMSYPQQAPGAYQPSAPSAYQVQAPNPYAPPTPDSYQGQPPSPDQQQVSESYQPQPPNPYQPQQPNPYQPQPPNPYQPPTPGQ
ncbi:MAG: hypothetical protein FWG47_02460 [Propionibacteriaceae bacterium]|nr:hypothetical protein [Propionibacteriaceae bacterium]